ncbi:MAG: FAD-dependent oxidoreductase [Pseudomonadota bacterium]|nr:FAD-dependent oxidoreductase [Pseudomonadota bacterium]
MSVKDHIECVVIGAGVVGLGIGRALSVSGYQTLVLEKNPWIGNETSSRNNEIIHAGFLYEPGSLRAKLFPEACEALYEYCKKQGVKTINSGKLVFAVSDDEISILETMKRYAVEGDVKGVEIIGCTAVHKLEPELRCTAALYSKTSGLVDSHGLMVAFLGEMEGSGGMLVLNTTVKGGRIKQNGFEVNVLTEGEKEFSFSCDVLVNAAGLGAQDFAENLCGFDKNRVPDLFLGKGSYFSFSGNVPFSRHISPVGETQKMGGTLTFDLAGRAKFGPDFELIETENYSVDVSRRKNFVRAIRRYWPALDEQKLRPDYAGIRPMLRPNRDVQHDDWLIDGPNEHGHKGLVHLFGLGSPGLTASLTLGEYICSLVA